MAPSFDSERINNFASFAIQAINMRGREICGFNPEMFECIYDERVKVVRRSCVSRSDAQIYTIFCNACEKHTEGTASRNYTWTS